LRPDGRLAPQIFSHSGEEVVMPALNVPPTRIGTDGDDRHGEFVPDPYRWLEDTDDPETTAWIGRQNEATESFLATLPMRDVIGSRIAELWDYPKIGAPFERGGRWFQFRNSGLQNQPLLYVMDSPDEEGRVLLDPNLLSEDGTLAVTGVQATHDGSLLAYATSAAGSDWKTWHVRDVVTGTDTDGVVQWSKFCVASWRKDASGFYYGALDRPLSGDEYLEKVHGQRVLFHRLGTSQQDDELVFAAPDEPEWMASAAVTEDGRYLVISIGRGTRPETQVHVLDLETPMAGLQPLVAEFAFKASVVTNIGAVFYLLTDHGAERQRIVAVDLERPQPENWRQIVPEAADTLRSAHHFGDKLVCHYLKDARSALRVFDLDGTYVRDIPVPGLASLAATSDGFDGLEGRPGSDCVHFAVTSFTESGALWSHDLASGATTLVRPSAAKIDPGDFVTEQVFATSGDGSEIPLFLTRRRDVVPTGEVPALLFGYGGFDVPVTPFFSVAHAVWLERGGALAVAVLRGGGEYGRAWRDGGKLANKQNVFDDFCAAARWLSDSGWSRPARIAINGGSNGGLLVGACIAQHPELFAVAVPEVGVLDMLRFHKFTIGWAWTSDFGDPDDPSQYRWVRSYSPLHNLKPHQHYPATLVMTGDHDDRVVPGHSFKFAAALQAAQGGQAPILIRIETSAGHGIGKPTSKSIAERADMLAFIEGAMGLPADPR
jgi:prolyl oligopeptidase